MQDLRKFYIDGRWVEPVVPRTLDVINPADEKPLAGFPDTLAAMWQRSLKTPLTPEEFQAERLRRKTENQNNLTLIADFTGAGDVHTAKIHLAYGWQDATFEDYQRVLIEAKISTMNDYHGNNSQLRRSVMNEKDWFYAIKACPSFREARDVLKQMETAGHRLNAFAYSYVLDRAKRDHQRKDGWALFDYFFDEGGKIDEALYTAAMGVSPDSKTALDVFDAMREAMAEQGEVPGERAYNMAISEQDNNFAVALSLFHEMKRKGVAVSRYTVYALFDACQSFANAVTVMMEARRSDVEINDASFVEELCNSTRYPELNDWNIKQWQAEGLSHHDVIVRLVDSISGDPFRSDALEVLRRKPTPPPS